MTPLAVALGILAPIVCGPVIWFGLVWLVSERRQRRRVKELSERARRLPTSLSDFTLRDVKEAHRILDEMRGVGYLSTRNVEPLQRLWHRRAEIAQRREAPRKQLLRTLGIEAPELEAMVRLSSQLYLSPLAALMGSPRRGTGGASWETLISRQAASEVASDVQKWHDSAKHMLVTDVVQLYWQLLRESMSEGTHGSDRSGRRVNWEREMRGQLESYMEKNVEKREDSLKRTMATELLEGTQEGRLTFAHI